MSAEGVLRFIAVVELHFPRPKFNDDERMEAAWLASMQRSLCGYPDDVLAEAAHRTLRDRVPKRDGRFFPVPSECEEVCRRVMNQKRAEETPLLGYKQADIPYQARCDFAVELMKSPMAKLARKEGWDRAMFYFCVDEGRVPGGHEIDQCKQVAKEFAAEYERCLKGERAFGAAWARYAESMVRKAGELMKGSP